MTAIATLEARPVVGVKVFDDGLALIQQPHAQLARTPAKVEVLVVVGEVAVEAAHGREELPLQRDVGGVEARPLRVLGAVSLELCVVEERARPVEPAVQVVAWHRRMPDDPPQHRNLVGGLAAVARNMTGHELRPRDHVVADEEHEIAVACAYAVVARHAGAGVLLLVHPYARQLGYVIVHAVYHDDCLEAARRLALECGEREA